VFAVSMTIAIGAPARLQPGQKPRSANIFFTDSKVSREVRDKIKGHKGMTVWMTGFSGSGKTTVAQNVEKLLMSRAENPMLVYRLDGDNLRFGLNADLGFSEEDRKENVRRVAEVAKLFSDAGFIVICSLIAPYKADREEAREIHNVDNVEFIEVFINAPLAVAEKRDPKGLYKKARAGKIKGFTGIDAPYEAPDKPDVDLDTSRLSIDESSQVLIDEIIRRTSLAQVNGTAAPCVGGNCDPLDVAKAVDASVGAGEKKLPVVDGAKPKTGKTEL